MRIIKDFTIEYTGKWYSERILCYEDGIGDIHRIKLNEIGYRNIYAFTSFSETIIYFTYLFDRRVVYKTFNLNDDKETLSLTLRF